MQLLRTPPVYHVFGDREFVGRRSRGVFCSLCKLYKTCRGCSRDGRRCVAHTAFADLEIDSRDRWQAYLAPYAQVESPTLESDYLPSSIEHESLLGCARRYLGICILCGIRISIFVCNDCASLLSQLQTTTQRRLRVYCNSACEIDTIFLCIIRLVHIGLCEKNRSVTWRRLSFGQWLLRVDTINHLRVTS